MLQEGKLQKDMEKILPHESDRALEPVTEMWYLNLHWPLSGQGPKFWYLMWSYPYVEKAFGLGGLHMLLSAKILFSNDFSAVISTHSSYQSSFWLCMIEVSFSPQGDFEVSLCLSLKFTFFFPGFSSWWLHLRSHSDSQSSWILVYFCRCGARPYPGIQVLEHKELTTVIKRGDLNSQACSSVMWASHLLQFMVV